MVDNPKAGLLAAALILAGDGLGLLRGLRLKPSRTNCAQCGCDIPPGRPGRRCQTCREAPPPQVIELPPYGGGAP